MTLCDDKYCPMHTDCARYSPQDIDEKRGFFTRTPRVKDKCEYFARKGEKAAPLEDIIWPKLDG